MRLINIVTPVTRPENLPAMLDSILTAKEGVDVEVKWWLIFDKPADFELKSEWWRGVPFVHAEKVYTADSRNMWGGPQRNRAYDLITDGFVTSVDDDNAVHPDYFRAVSLYMGRPVGLLYGQQFLDGGVKVFECEDLLRHFEHSMMTVHHSLIGDVRMPGTHDCDKQFARPIFEKHRDLFLIMPHVLCYYNWLRG